MSNSDYQYGSYEWSFETEELDIMGKKILYYFDSVANNVINTAYNQWQGNEKKYEFNLTLAAQDKVQYLKFIFDVENDTIIEQYSDLESNTLETVYETVYQVKIPFVKVKLANPNNYTSGTQYSLNGQDRVTERKSKFLEKRSEIYFIVSQIRSEINKNMLKNNIKVVSSNVDLRVELLSADESDPILIHQRAQELNVLYVRLTDITIWKLVDKVFVLQLPSIDNSTLNPTVTIATFESVIPTIQTLQTIVDKVLTKNNYDNL